MPEANELFEGWVDYPPTNILVKAIVGWTSGTGTKGVNGGAIMPPEAAEAMEKAALAEIQAKGAGRIPIVRGRDKGLPKAPPVFDVEAMRAHNTDVAKTFAKRPT